ncbi:hypothetical protein B0J15DRAFT_533921 [Fusarium solani]|uniref:Zn(2)-C6 fungal-type domain-containing protein n=1 Tax=Fusarium solani TaxID=169388 RepID=A0A9P9KUK3_FUSSL|nr:uncharacterized protein B0J15DRAFT_533921 [Fusarium solani]KAH7268655.1 hypothetical protein B0J15DRAFT_533921 [Fusarium solani]
MNAIFDLSTHTLLVLLFMFFGTDFLNCRNRRIKCDEKKPCSYCTRRGLECIQPEFIVRHGWSESAAATTATNSEPATSYETFRQIYSAEHAGTALPSTEVTVSSEVLTNDTAKLLRIYQQGIGTWMDILDHSLTFQRQVLPSALSSPLLFHSICALSAKQMSLTQDNGLWEPISSHHYGESLRLLIHDVTVEGTKRATMLSATILLCSYELLAFPGADYQRHLFGGRTLIEADFDVVSATNLGRASFWIYARQDVSLALVNERPTLIPPKEWPAVPFSNERQEDALGKRILWLLARVIEIRFAIPSHFDGVTLEDHLDAIVSEIVHWSESVPSHARGVDIQGDLADGLKQTWFCVPSAGQR